MINYCFAFSVMTAKIQGMDLIFLCLERIVRSVLYLVTINEGIFSFFSGIQSNFQRKETTTFIY